MSDIRYIVAAYAVSWIVLLAYGAYLSSRKHSLQRAAAERAALGGGREP